MKALKLSAFIMSFLSSDLYADELAEYDLSLIHGRVERIDITAITTGKGVLSGTYPMTIVLNEKSYGLIPVTMTVISGEMHIIWNQELLNALPFSDKLYDILLHSSILSGPVACEIDLAAMTLSCKVDQKELRPSQTNYANKAARDNGVNAFMASYRINYNRYKAHDGDSNENSNASVLTGANIGAWRARTKLYTSSNNKEGTNINESVIFRNLNSINSQIKIGFDFTANNMLDSFRYKGVSLATDTSMLPPESVDFMPVVSGTVHTNATITVKKNGTIVYQENVPPGQYLLKGIPSIQGEFTVEEREADGTLTIRSYYGSGLSQFIRKDEFRYESVVGTYAGYSSAYKPEFLLGTAQYGLTENMNVYSGGIIASQYNAIVYGTLANIGMLGALSADNTHSVATKVTSSNSRFSGSQSKIQYSKRIDSTATQLYLGTAMYNQNFLGFSDYTEIGNYYNSDYALKSRQSAGIIQPFGKNYVNIQFQKNTYKRDITKENYIVSLNGVLENRKLNSSTWSLQYQNLSYKSQIYSNVDHQLFVSISTPLGINRKTYLTQAIRADKAGSGRYQTSLSGTSDDSKSNYNIGYIRDVFNDTENNTFNGSVGYKGSATGVDGYVSGSNSSSQLGGQLQGSLVFVGNQLAMSSRPLSRESTIALIDTAGISGAKVNHSETSFLGTSIVDNLSPYRFNKMSLDASSLPADVVAGATAKNFAPTKGAVAKITFDIEKKNIAIITLDHLSNPPPLGVSIFDENDREIGMVSNMNEIYIDKFDEKQKRTIRWGNNNCNLIVNDNFLAESNSIKLYSGNCK